MNDFNLSLFNYLFLLNWILISSLSASFAIADDEICATENASTLDACKEKVIEISGLRPDMFDMPEYFMFADPSFSGGEGFQDYIVFDETNMILHTDKEVECPEELTVKGLLKQVDLEGNAAWIIEVNKLKCKE